MLEHELKNAVSSVKMTPAKKEALAQALRQQTEQPRRSRIPRGFALAAACVLVFTLGAVGWRLAAKKQPTGLPTSVPHNETDAAVPSNGASAADTDAALQTDAAKQNEDPASGEVDSVNSPNTVAETTAPGNDAPTGIGNLWNVRDPKELENVHWRTLVRGEPGTDTGKYPCPLPGTHAYSVGLGEALREYAGRDDVNYYVRIEVFPPDGLPDTPQAQQAYYETLRERLYETLSIDDVGFEISVFENLNTGEAVVTFGAMVYHAAVFDAFPDLPDVGLFLSLYDEITEIK